MTRHYPDLGSASDWLKQISHAARPIRSITQIWVVTRHQYRISALASQTSFGGILLLASRMSAVFSGYYHAGYLCECAGDANDSAHAEKKRERNLYQKVTRVLLYLSGMGVELFFLIYFLTHQLTQTLVALYNKQSMCLSKKP